MAFAARRLAALLAVTTLAMVGGVAGQIGVAAAADPITSEPAPTLTAPANDPSGATPLKDVVLKWTAVAHADSYQVQISPNGDWTNNTVSLPGGGKTVNTVYDVPISLPHAFYFWRVRALHNSSHTAWSSSRTFLREWVAQFDMLSIPTDTNPSLSWQPVAGASLYRVRFGTKRDFRGGTTFTCSTAQTTFTPYKPNMSSAEKLSGDCFDASALTKGQKYFWEVIAYDDSSAEQITADTANDGGWECTTIQPECDTYFPADANPDPSFTFDPPVKGAFDDTTFPTGLTTTWHADTATANDCTDGTCPETPTFSWDPVAGANYYEVHVWRDPALRNTYRVYDTSFTSITPREDFFDAQAGTSYFWSVAAATCQSSAAVDYCATSPAGATATSPTCPPATAATAPSVDGLSVAPPGPQGAQSMSAGSAGTVTLTGAGFASGACVAAANGAGTVQNINVVDSGHITFDYTAPASSTTVTFQVVNPDGGTSNASPQLVVVGDLDLIDFGPLAPPVSFDKQSGAVDLNAVQVNGGSVTFSWDGFLSGAGQGGYDVRNYRLQVATDPDFGNVVWDVADIDMTQFTNPDALLPDGTWFWRVQGIDQSDNHLTWSDASTFTLDSTPPTLRLTTPDGVAVDGTLTFTSDETVTGVSSSTVHVAPVGGGAVSATVTKTGARTWKLNPTGPLATGATYHLIVDSAVQDAAGNSAIAAGTVRTTRHADDKSSGWSFSGSWTRHSSSQALGGTYSSSGSGHSATLKLAGAKVKLFACRGPSFGKLSVSVDGHHKTTVDEHKSFTQCGVLVWSGTISSSAVHTLKLTVATGTATLDQVRVS